MNRQKLISIATMPGLAAMACFLGAFAPIPSTTVENNDRIAISSDSNINPASDNSAMNRGDQSSQAPTADQAGNTMSDRDIMKKIRHEIVSDKSLSTYAHNVKVISQNGKVTLKGPVNSDQEKQSIEAKATNVAGDGNVVDDLSIKGAN